MIITVGIDISKDKFDANCVTLKVTERSPKRVKKDTLRHHAGNRNLTKEI